MKNNREKEILNELMIRGRLELGEVMQSYDISESTTRRLFAKLEQEGNVIRTHGGIQLIGANFTEYSFEKLSHANLPEKNAIASSACSLIEDGDIIFCDAGTTVLCFCIKLARHIKNENLNVQVFTNSLANLDVLSPDIEVSLVGGNYRAHRKDLCGYLTETVLEKLHFSKCFLGADGCDMRKRFSTTDFDTARMGEIVIRNSSRTIILCDSSKFSKTAQIGFASFDEVNTTVTDHKLDSIRKKKLESYGMTVLCAAEE